MSSEGCACDCVDAGSLVARARVILNDGARQCAGDAANFTHWSDEVLRSYLNEALGLLVSVRPDAFSSTEVITLKPGMKQNLPPEYDALIQVISNVDGSGAISDPVSEGDDDYTRVAPSKCGNDGECGPDFAEYKVSSYSRFAQSQTEFIVQPPVPASGDFKLCVRVVKQPELLCEASSCIPVPVKFHAALVNWVLHRAFSKDIESAFATGQAERYYRWFFETLEIQRVAESRFRSGYYLGMVGTEDPQARNR